MNPTRTRDLARAASALLCALLSTSARYPLPQDPPAEDPAREPEVEAPATDGQAEGLAPVTMTVTQEMDGEVVALIAERVAAVGQEPASAAAHAELGLAYEANTYWTEAQACYRNVLQLLPAGQEDEARHKIAEWRFRLAVMQHSNGDLLGAIESMRAVAQVFRNTPVVQARLGDMLLEIGAIDEATGAWEQAIVAEEKSQGIWAVSRVGLARARIEQEDYEGAVEMLEAALELEPGMRAAQFQLGLALIALGREEEAELALSRGVNAFSGYPPDPHQPRLDGYAAGFQRRMMRIENMLAAGLAPQALAELERVYEARPENHMVLNTMAKAHMLTGREGFVTALDLLQRSEALEPSSYATKAELTTVLLNLNRLDEAMQKAQEAAQIAPLIGRNHYLLGMCLYLSANSALRSNPQDQEAMQRKQAALASFQQALLRGCREPGLFQNLAQVYAEMGRNDRMLEFGLEFARVSPDDASAHVFLTRVYLTLFEGSPTAEYAAAARKSLERAMEVGPEHPEVKQMGPALMQAVQVAEAKANPEQGPPRPEADGGGAGDTE